MWTRRGTARERERPCILDIRNRILMVFIWLRNYPCSSVLSAMFMVNEDSINKDVHMITNILWYNFHQNVSWPNNDQWRMKMNSLEWFPGCVGFIDGTRHEIYIPAVEPQRLFYSGHCCFHNFSTQIIIDVDGNICYIQSGFLGHNNDAGQLLMMPDIGNGMPLNLPLGAYIIGDGGYPNRYPVLTAFRRQNELNEEQELFNYRLRAARVQVEHKIRRMKEYRAVASIWRHPRWFFPIVAELTAFLAQRHIMLSRIR